MMKVVPTTRTLVLWGAVIFSSAALLYAMLTQQGVPQWAVWTGLFLFGVGSALPDGKQSRPEDTADGH